MSKEDVCELFLVWGYGALVVALMILFSGDPDLFDAIREALIRYVSN